jgi:hypothetical protein
MATGTNEGKKHFKVTMFFPLEDNEGNAFDDGTWQWWHDGIDNVISGLTDLGIVDGWWQGRSDRNKLGSYSRPRSQPVRPASALCQTGSEEVQARHDVF